MSGGRERGIILWEVRATLLRVRDAAVREELESLASIQEPPTRKRRERMAELEGELRHIMIELAQLGPDPRPKMG
jgi:hypothetical protein